METRTIRALLKPEEMEKVKAKMCKDIVRRIARNSLVPGPFQPLQRGLTDQGNNKTRLITPLEGDSTERERDDALKEGSVQPEREGILGRMSFERTNSRRT